MTDTPRLSPLSTGASNTSSVTDSDIYSLPKPELHFDADGVPGSAHFDDVYFSRDNGLAETDYIFIKHNQLAERWAALDKDTANHTNMAGEFVIGETGFGTGLNFLAAAELWLKVAPQNWQLHFITTELYPLPLAQLQQALACWPRLRAIADELITHYPPRLRGMHIVSMFDGRIKLHLHYGDAAESLASILTPAHGLVDAWFLDGFSPAKNPGMWHQGLFTEIGRLSKPRATVTTFTVAGVVKDGLRNAGFVIEKVPGHGRKKQMLRGVYPDENQAPKKLLCNPLPFWAKPLATVNTNVSNSKASITIIGAGLAGCTTASALARRGYKVTLIDRENGAAQSASGNKQGVLYGTLSPKPNKINLFALYSYLYARNFYRDLLAVTDIAGELCGHLQLLRDDKDVQLGEQLKPLLAGHPNLCRWVDAATATEIAGVPVKSAALFFPGSGWLSPPDICATLIAQPNITTQYQTEALSLERIDDAWQVFDNQKKLISEATIVIIANATDAAMFDQTRWLPIKPIRGQTTTIAATSCSQKLRTVICHDGYIAPAIDDRHCIGATFDLHNQDLTARDADDQFNLATLNTTLPDLLVSRDQSILDNRVGFRATTPDYLPVCGPVPIVDNFRRDYNKLRYDARFDIEIPGSYWPDLYLNTGHGARGLGYTPLCADWLTSLIANGVRPLAADMSLSIHPARFIIKGIIRNKI